MKKKILLYSFTAFYIWLMGLCMGGLGIIQIKHVPDGKAQLTITINPKESK